MVLECAVAAKAQLIVTGLPAVQQAAAAVSACPCRGRRCPLCRPPVGCGVSAVRIRCPRVRTVDVCRLRRPGRNPGASTERTPWQCPLDIRDCGQVLAGRPPIAADTAAAPLSRAGTWWSPAADRPCTSRRLRPVDANRRIRCPRWQQNLDVGGCPDEGVHRTTGCRRPVDTAAVSAVRPKLRRLAMPSGRLGSTADTAAARGVSAATGSGRRPGGR
jgi:hypothetical protein